MIKKRHAKPWWHGTNQDKEKVVMTARKAVPDDVLGQVATKQWELYRRVKEGTLDPHVVLAALQGIVQNEADRLPIERVDWNVSARVYEVMVDEAEDFVEFVRQCRCKWNLGNKSSGTTVFILKGDPKKPAYRVRLRLAQLTKGHTEQYVSDHDIRVYADIDGYELATPWDLLAFVRKSPVLRINRPRVKIIALGGTEQRHICVDDQCHPWNFDAKWERHRIGTYILLREKNNDK